MFWPAGTSPLATIFALESPTTSQPQANQLNQNNEDDLTQIDQITQNYELESRHSIGVRNNKSARLHADFADQTVLGLVNSGRVRMVNEKPFVVNPLSVSIEPCGKKRLILDLRHINKSLIKQSVKYEDWKIAVLFCERRVHVFL